MYLRTTQRKNRDGSVIRYVQLAHNRRVDGVTQAQVLLNLGREDQLDRDGLRRLVASINHYLGEPDGGLPPADAAQLAGDGLTVVASRPVGADAQAEAREAVFFAVAELHHLAVDVLFFDTSSSYFERGTEATGEDACGR